MGIIHIYSIHGSHGYYLSAYARQPARGPTMWPILWLCWPMLAYVDLSCGQCGPILWLCWAMLASGWFMLSQKIRKMGTAKKHCKTHDILMVGGLSWGYVGPSWGYVGLSWGQCGPILGLCWPILGPCWPILELWWPILGLSWPILGLCWPILRPMLAHLEGYVGPCWPILSHKIRKMGKMGRAQNTVKRDSFWRYRLSIGRGGGPSLLRRGENCRTAMPGRIKGCRPCRRPRNKQPRLADLLGVSHHFEWAIFRFSNNLTCLLSVIIY